MSIWSFKDKIGPGVSKNEAKAPAYIRFFKTFFTRFPTMVALNLLYLFCCLPIITIGAATAALNAFSRELLESHMRTCVRNDILAGRDETIDEFLGILKKMM